MPIELAVALLAGVAAGAINTIVGSGTLITFPVLLAFGYPPLTANVTNNLGLVPGSLAGAWGYRRELRGQRRRLAHLLPATLSGAVLGAVLLLVLPSAVFETVVPLLVAGAVVLVVLQPRLQRAMRARRAALVAEDVAAADARARDATVHDARARDAAARPDAAGPDSGVAAPPQERLAVAVPATAAIGVYGGYFGAAQGVVLLGVLGTLLDDDLQRVNAAKNVLAAAANLVAAVVFLLLAPEAVVWPLAAAIATGALLGGLLGARLGRRLRPGVLRLVIVVVGVVAVGRLLAG